MTKRPYDKVFARLEGVRPSGRGNERKCSARCPAHDDRTASLSVRESRGGNVLVKCFAGCSAEAIADALGVPLPEWFAEPRQAQKRESDRLTVDLLARHKGLPPALLRGLGLRESGRYVLIPYLDERGNEVRPQLRRADGGHRWGRPADAPMLPYGLDRRPTRGAIALVEGCSDCWTLWNAGIDALGIPGADMVEKLQAAHVAGIGRLYVVKEDDAGGATFVRNVAARLEALGFGGEAFVVDMASAGANDPSALYLCDPSAFAAAWERLVTDAQALAGAPALTEVIEDEPDASAEAKAAAAFFDVRPLPAWLEEAAAKPVPQQLFGECWFEGELCILFAETNVGKSILAVQIADAVTRGRPALHCFPVEAGPSPVLLLDFELSPKQFHGRYSVDYGRPHAFAPGFLRAEVNADFDFEGEWASLMIDAIETAVLEHGVRIVIVDNVTYLRDETERAKGALPLMRSLNAMKKRLGLSMLALAHTPKRDASRPITRNDLAGSRRLLDFADSCFALGESHRDEGMRYLKQIKVREADFTLDGGNVALLSLAKREGFLRFDLEGYAQEAEHLRARRKGENDELDAAILEAYRSDPSLSQRAVARRLGTNHKRVGRVLQRNRVGLSGTSGTGVPPVPDASERSSGDGTHGVLPAEPWDGEDVFGHDNWAPF